MANPYKSKSSSSTLPKSQSNPLASLLGGNTKKSGLDANWAEVHPDVLRDLLWAITTVGGSVTLGCTKNNNAYSVKVFIGAPYDAMYFDGDAEGRAQLTEWVQNMVIAIAESA